MSAPRKCARRKQALRGSNGTSFTASRSPSHSSRYRTRFHCERIPHCKHGTQRNARGHLPSASSRKQSELCEARDRCPSFKHGPGRPQGDGYRTRQYFTALGRDSLPGEGFSENRPAAVPLPFVDPTRVPAARDSAPGLRSLTKKGQTHTREARVLEAFS